MNSTVLHQRATVGPDNTVTIAVPSEMTGDVDVFVVPCSVPNNDTPMAFNSMAALMDCSGFARTVLNSAEEDCWNDL